MAPGLEKQCQNFNKTICQTKYKEKEIERDLLVTLMKAIPETTCESVLIEEEICMTPQCPLVFHNKICEAKERSYVAIVPKVIIYCSWHQFTNLLSPTYEYFIFMKFGVMIILMMQWNAF